MAVGTAPTNTINGLKAGDCVRCREFPDITGCVLSVCENNQIVVRAPYGELLDDARSWSKTHLRF
jgi:hypothetical protein